ncbi:hypothetical protein [Streptomyces sp. A5-4]
MIPSTPSIAKALGAVLVSSAAPDRAERRRPGVKARRTRTHE